MKRIKIQWRPGSLPWKLVLIGLLIALLAGVTGELAFNLRSLTNPDPHGAMQITPEEITYMGCEEENGYYSSKGKTMVLRIQIPEQYVNKLLYTYVTPKLNVRAQVTVHETDGYGQETTRVLEDRNSILRNYSVVTVNAVTDEIELRFLEPTEGLTVTSVSVDDAPSYSKMRFLFFAAGSFLIYLLIICRKMLAEHVERIFLILALPVGILMILGFSPRETGWDEHIHFYRAYSLMYDLAGKETMPVADAMYQYMNAGMANEPFYFPRSQEENAQERAVGDEGRWEANGQPEQYRETNGIHIYSIAYLPQTLFLAVGLLFHVPFWILVAMGRAGNLLFYCLLCYLAIRHMKRGKGILLVIALFPTSILLASTYSYDAFINGWMLLGMSYLFTELLEKERPVSVRNLTVFAAAVTLASLPKAVYIPLILLGLLVPAERFEKKKTKWLFRGALFLLLLLLMSTFLLPAAGNAQVVTDTRGGDTNAGEQLALILSHPVSYASLLLKSIGENLVNCLFGRSVGGNLAYRGALTFGEWLCPFVIFTIFADNTGVQGRYRIGLGKWQRLYTAVLVFGVICLVWTALYLSYTPVGLQAINGVQGRYYIPLLVPVYLLLQCDGIQNRMKTETYYRILSAGCLFFLLDGLWSGVISMCF